MKIIHFAHTYIPIYGGTTTRLTNLFANDGNTHTFIVPYLGSEYVPKTVTSLNRRDIYDNILVIRKPLSVVKTTSLPFLEYISKIRMWRKKAEELLSDMDEGDFDIVYGHNPMEFAIAAARFSKSCGIPLIYEVHGLIKDTLFLSSKIYKRPYNWVGNFFVVWMEREILKRSKYVIVQTERMKERVSREYRLSNKKIGVIYNGVNMQMFSPDRYEDVKRNLKDMMHLHGKVVVSYFGFLDENNGIKFFLMALDKLSRDIKDKIKVLIIGRGPYSDLVSEYAAKNDFMSFLGSVEYTDIAQYYGITEIFAIPRPSNKATEHLVPMKLLEAMAMEKILLVSNVGGMTEVVSDGFNGIVYKKGDLEDFIKKLTDLVLNLEDYKHLRKAARETVSGIYTWDSARLKLSRIYNSVLCHHRW